MRGFFVVVLALSVGTGCGSPKAAVPDLVAPAPVTSLPTHAWGAPQAVSREAPPPAIQRSTHTCVVAERDVRSFGRSVRAIETVRQEVASLERNLSLASAPAHDAASTALALGDAETELAELDPSGADELLASAKRHYQLSASGSGPETAEAKYRLGVLAECDHDLPTARKLYFQVVSEAPRGPLLPYAYFAFGELFAEESKQDPSKTELARQSYAECTKLGRGVIENLARERLRTLANPP
jgi:TolA-binding protein